MRAERDRELAAVRARPKGTRKGPRAEAFARGRERKAAALEPCKRARAELRDRARVERAERAGRALRRSDLQRRASVRAAEKARERREKEVDNVRGAAGDEAAQFFASQWPAYARRARAAKGAGHGRTYPYELFLEDLEREPETFRAWQAARDDARHKRLRKARGRSADEDAEREDWEARQLDERRRRDRAALDEGDPFGDLSDLRGDDAGGGWDEEDDGPARQVANGRKRHMASDKVLAKRLRAWSRRWVVPGMGAALVSLEAGKGLPRSAALRLHREFERAAVKPGFRASERATGAWLTRELAARAAGAPAAKKRRKKVDDAPRVVRAARKVKRAVKSGAGVEASARIGRAKVGAAVGVRSNPSRAKKRRNPDPRRFRPGDRVEWQWGERSKSGTIGHAPPLVAHGTVYWPVDWVDGRYGAQRSMMDSDALSLVRPRAGRSKAAAR